MMYHNNIKVIIFGHIFDSILKIVFTFLGLVFFSSVLLLSSSMVCIWYSQYDDIFLTRQLSSLTPGSSNSSVDYTYLTKDNL